MVCLICNGAHAGPLDGICLSCAQTEIELRPLPPSPTKAEIFKGHAEIWREQAHEYGECVGWERNEADKEFWGAMGHFCERMAERYEKAAEETG